MNNFIKSLIFNLLHKMKKDGGIVVPKPIGNHTDYSWRNSSKSLSLKRRSNNRKAKRNHKANARKTKW